MKIEDDLPTSVISVVANACGFQVAYSREPDVDEWSLSSGHGENHVEYVGTRQVICAFLSGFVAMRERAVQLLSDLRAEQQESFHDVTNRLVRPAANGRAEVVRREYLALRPREDELDSVLSLLNWVRTHHDADSAARTWLERVVTREVGR